MKIALLSNSSNIKSDKVIESLSMIDEPIFKLDAGTEEKFCKINYPAEGILFYDIVNDLKKIGRRIIIQTILIDGEPSNIGVEELENYYNCIRDISPKEVHIYSIDRPVPEKKIKKILPEQLEKIAKEGTEKTGILFKAFYIK